MLRTMIRACVATAAGGAGLLTYLIALPALAADFFPEPRGYFLPVGLTIGGAIHPALRHDLVVGGEASFVAYDMIAPQLWLGGYADALWDTGAEAFRFTTGPEIGWSFVGIDLGYLGQAGEHGDYHHGVSIRPMLTMGLVTLAGRYGHLFGKAAEPDFGEITVLLKFPIPIELKP